MHVCFDHHRQLADRALLDALEHLFKRSGLGSQGCELRLLALLALAVFGDIARPLLALHHLQPVAGLGHPIQAEHLDRR